MGLPSPSTLSRLGHLDSKGYNRQDIPRRSSHFKWGSFALYAVAICAYFSFPTSVDGTKAKVFPHKRFETREIQSRSDSFDWYAVSVLLHDLKCLRLPSCFTQNSFVTSTCISSLNFCKICYLTTRYFLTLRLRSLMLFFPFKILHDYHLGS
jgi:hypothetical protein